MKRVREWAPALLGVREVVVKHLMTTVFLAIAFTLTAAYGRSCACSDATSSLEARAVSTDVMKRAEEDLVHKLLAGSNTRLWSL